VGLDISTTKQQQKGGVRGCFFVILGCGFLVV